MSKFGTHTDDEFHATLNSFYQGCQKIRNEHLVLCKMQNIMHMENWQLQMLNKRARIVSNGGVHCFVDYATGDVLKSASWAVPAKHARGNIYDEHNGLKFIGPYGPAYLR